MYLNTNLNQSCENCLKKDVCKHTEEKSKVNLGPIPDFLSVEIKCKYYCVPTEYSNRGYYCSSAGIDFSTITNCEGDKK